MAKKGGSMGEMGTVRLGPEVVEEETFLGNGVPENLPGYRISPVQ